MKTRVISAIVALIIVIPLIILGGIFFELGMVVIALLGYKELMDLKESHKKIPREMKVIGFISVCLLMLSNLRDTSIYKGLTYPILALVVILILVPIIFYKNDEYTSKEALYLLGSVLFLGLTFKTFIIIRNKSLDLLLFLIVPTIINDTCAYLIGSKFGRHKMCASISPNKTWEGSLAGFVGGVTTALLIHHFLIGDITFKIIIIAVAIAVMDQVGDLVLSKIKRENKIKDFSNLMPGHGGILDRLDSLIFVFLTYIVLIAL